ncbi:MAG: methyltransferase domain-containing protein [Bacteroidetes bacterium]|jgi:2-polyprenyl-3-methyl-5-hydroxy-6-metoxy-1,4-benzoquinol methylase|nr:methyltransferase domain-containing protein [Bacteroidota bacterium]
MTKNSQWDLLAYKYAEIKNDVKQNFLFPALKETIKNHCIDAKSLLDYGCGPGDLVVELVEDFDRVAVTDLSSAALEIISKRFGDNIEVFTLAEINGSNESFDVITMNLVLTAIPDNTELLEIFSVIRHLISPHGWLIISTTHPCFTFRALATVPYKISGGAYKVPIGNLEITEYHRPLESIMNIISSTGFHIIHVKEIYDTPEYYMNREEEPSRFSGILPIFIVLVCKC